MATDVAVLAGAGLVLGLTVGAIVGSLPVGGAAGLLVGAGAGAGAVGYGLRSAPGLALGDLELAPADPERHPRLHNLTRGLSVSVGVSTPELVVVDTPAANAAAVGRSHTEATVVVTAGLLEVLDRVELEGVLAHQLRRIRDLDALVGTRAVPFAAVPAAAAPSLLGSRVAPLLGEPEAVFAADRAAVDLTRYPPGLASALVKVVERGAEVPGAPARGAHLWLVPPAGADTAAPSVDDRVAALREL